MSKAFSFGNLNKSFLENNQSMEHSVETDDKINYMQSIAGEITDVFSSHQVNMEDAYMILITLADAIYMYAVTGDDENK